MGIQIKGSNDTISADDGSIVLEGATLTFTNENITGISTMASAEVTGNLSIADKIIHTGDTNTALRFPAADTVTVETGGSEAIRVDSSQNFGVGTASPTARFDVRRGDADGKIAEFHQSTGYGIDIGSSQALAYISSGYNQAWAFKTDAGSGQVERLRITSDGKILAGGHSSGSIISAGGVESLNGSGNNFGAGRFVAGAGGPDFWFIKSRNATAGSHTVVQSGDTTGTIQFAGSDGDSWTRTASIVSEVDGTPGDADMPGRLIFNTTADGASSPTERLRIDKDGQILIAAAGANRLSMRHSSGGNFVIKNPTAANLSFGTNDADDDVVIQNGGLVGINTTAPTALLSFGVQRSVQTYPPICFQTAYGSGLADAAISTTDDSGGTDIMMGSNVYMGQNGTFTRYFSSYGSAAVRCGYTGNTMFYNKSGNNAPAESMRIDGSGNVKIGGHSTNRDLGGLSVQRLHIEGTDGGSSAIGIVNNQNSTGTAALYFSKSRGTSLNSNTILQDDDPMGGIVWCGSDGNDMISQGARIMANVDGTPGSNDMPGRLTFSTTADGAATVTDRMLIDSSGRTHIARSGTLGELNSNDATLHVVNPTDGGTGAIYVHMNGQGGGTASPTYGIKIDAHNTANDASHQYGMMIDVNQQLISGETGILNDVYGSYNTTKCYDAILRKGVGAYTAGYSYYSKIIETGTGGSTYHFYGEDDGTLKVRIERDGDVQNANNSYGSTSDVKLKENIVDAGSQWADIKAVKVRNFNFISDPNNTKMIGVVAQEIETVSAGLVKTDNDITVDEATGEGTVTGTTKSVKYSILYMKAIKALQEAMTRIETLETKVTALESS